MEHALLPEDTGVLSVKAENKTDAEDIQTLQGALILRILILLQQGVVEKAHDIPGLDGNFHLVGQGFDFFLHEKVQEGVLRHQFRKMNLHRLRNLGVHVVNPNFRKIAG